MLEFFARNRVAANLLMVAIAVAGAATLLMRKLPLEVFPEFESDMITVSVPYRGATPEEVEESIVIRIEEAIADVEGIEEIVSTAGESGGTVNIEVDEHYDRREVLDEVESRVNAIPDFPPGDAEKTSVRLGQTDRWVISVVLYGDLSETDLRRLGEQVRDEITALPNVSSAELQGVRPYEITIEIDEAALQRHRLSFDEVSQALRASSIDVPAGTLQTAAGEIALRTKGRAYTKEEFENITLVTREDGTRLSLADVARVSDGFDENPFIARFNGRRCVLIAVFREGNQSAIRIADTVKDYMKEASPRLERYNVGIDFWSDSSTIVKGRLHTLLDSGWKSMLFVFILLALFLRPSLAFWVVMGIPISFLGTLALMPYLGVTINIVSLFAFILVLGVIVDDAIVTGENIYSWQQRGIDPETSAVKGAHEVALPVIFGVLTTILAFVPMFFGSGFSGEWQGQIATVVIATLTFSLLESKLILPAHLSHPMRGAVKRVMVFFCGDTLTRVLTAPYRGFMWLQQKFSIGLEKTVAHTYQPLLERCLKWRYLTLSIFLGTLAITVGWIAGGRLVRIPFPPVESDRVTCRLTMQEGTPFEVTERHVEHIADIVRELREEFRTDDGASVVEDVMVSIGGQGVSSSRGRSSQGQSHLGEVVFYLMPREERTARGIHFDNMKLVNDWRERIGEIMGAKELTFRAELFRGGDPIDVQLTGNDTEALTDAAAKVKAQLETYAGLFDVTDSLDESREEIQLRIKPEAEQFGLTMSALARQVRQAFFGEEIQRLQRSRDEVRVMLRYPEADRRSLAALKAMRIRTPDGQEVPFSTVADVVVGRSFPRIQRINRNRAVNVRADADKEVADLETIRTDLSAFLSNLMLEFPGMSYTFEGEAKDEREAQQAELAGMLLIIFGIYAMLAIPFRSYSQPLMVMLVIPFGLIGAVLGHIIEDMPLSKLSEFGMLALSGVVVNDSLVLVDFINRRVREGVPLFEAVRTAGAARFRPILLTSITTFGGLFPLLRLESTQAQVLIPMAISLGYGVLFATFITLFLVPVSYLVLEDIKSVFRVPAVSKDRSPAPPSEDPSGLASPAS
ncbi:MAG: efflux RND transporter permease subunit [Verrucomicrobiae bacterium]|nr:efflux RND transporter permease subunit [Verrucomicrobiae bacterium]